jgi:hypothetical protein
MMFSVLKQYIYPVRKTFAKLLLLWIVNNLLRFCSS